MRGQVAHVVDARVQKFESDDGFERVYQFLQIRRDDHADCRAEEDAEHADQSALNHEYDRILRGEEPNVRRIAMSRRLSFTT